LIASGKINIDPLVSHTFSFNEAANAYDLIVGKTEPFAGIILKYNIEKNLTSSVVFAEKKAIGAKVNAAFIGAGSFAQNILLPALKNKINFTGIVTARGNNSKYIAEKYAFDYCASSAEEIINDNATNCIFIATRHDSHFAYVKKALEAGKNVFCEKPLCLYEHELDELTDIYNSYSGILMLGFNRRFSSLVKKIKELSVSNLPIAINYRINAGAINPQHWTNDSETGGGRIIGEVCHFVDLCCFITGSKVNLVNAISMKTASGTEDTLTVSLSFENGSIASIAYLANGSKLMEKEYLEIFNNGKVFIVDDFRTLKIIGNSKKTIRLNNQDKGHVAEVNEFITAVSNGLHSPIPIEEIFHSTKVTFKIIESLRLGTSVPL
jgi:predicted dehydrogenase